MTKEQGPCVEGRGRTASLFTLTAIALALNALPHPALAQDAGPATDATTTEAANSGRFTVELGGQLFRPQSASGETYRPGFIDQFDPAIDPTGKQDGKFSWDAGGGLRVIYAPDADWRFSAGARLGERRRNTQSTLQGETLQTCRFEAPCDGSVPTSAGNGYVSRTNYGRSDVKQSEDHLLADFQVGRDIGIGGSMRGTVSAGLRYARFKSHTKLALGGTPDWQLPVDCFDGSLFGNCGKYEKPATRDEYGAEMNAHSKFSGFGPVLAWDASNRLFGSEASGQLDLDWSVSGGVLFGKQKADVEGVESAAYFRAGVQQQLKEGDTKPITSSTTPFHDQRSKSATVATLGLGLGLRYRIGGTSLGAGYRWERYFDATDNGIAARKTYDQTLDGPYLDVRVGFGGGV